MGEQFPHTSRAGHYGLVFDADLMVYLGTMATALIPGDEHYPSGADAQVATFIQDRSSESDRDTLLQLCSRWRAGTVKEAQDLLPSMESDDPLAFAYLRELVYHGYYSSRRVLAAMADRGYAYHGAPQPLGYRIDEPMRVPTKTRGTYLATENVTHVSH